MLRQLLVDLLELLELRHHRDLLVQHGLQARDECTVTSALLSQHPPHRALLCVLKELEMFDQVGVGSVQSPLMTVVGASGSAGTATVLFVLLGKSIGRFGFLLDLVSGIVEIKK